jgi:hypothetical protein
MAKKISKTGLDGVYSGKFLNGAIQFQIDNQGPELLIDFIKPTDEEVVLDPVATDKKTFSNQFLNAFTFQWQKIADEIKKDYPLNRFIKEFVKPFLDSYISEYELKGYKFGNKPTKVSKKKTSGSSIRIDKPIAQKPESMKATKKTAQNPKPAGNKAEKRTNIKPKRTKKVVQKTTRKTLDVRSAPKTGVANQFIRRIAYCINRKVDARTIINLVEDIKLANVQLQSIKSTQHFELIDRVYKQLAQTVNNLPNDADFVKIEVSDSLLSQIKSVTTNKESEASRLKKAYVRLQGKNVLPIDAKRLINRIDTAIARKSISPSDFSSIKGNLDKIASGVNKKIAADTSLAGAQKTTKGFKVGQKVLHKPSGGIMTIKSIRGGVASCYDENSKQGVSVVSLKSLAKLTNKPAVSKLSKKFKTGEEVLHKPTGQIVKIVRIYETKASYKDRAKIGGESLVPLVELEKVKAKAAKKK